jgi:hypothetical protein
MEDGKDSEVAIPFPIIPFSIKRKMCGWTMDRIARWQFPFPILQFSIIRKMCGLNMERIARWPFNFPLYHFPSNGRCVDGRWTG